MVELLQKSNLLIQTTSAAPVRSLYQDIDWSERLISILGARGTGKTTLLLQHLKAIYGTSGAGLYISLDDIYFTAHRLSDVAREFRQQGGKSLFIDEVHKYPDWAREIKNLYDFNHDLKLIFTGSSVTDLLRQNVDLSRRAAQYELPGLSYREYLHFSGITDLPPLSLSDLLTDHVEYALDISASVRPLKHFNDYLQYGYYPFFKERLRRFSLKLETMVRLVIETVLLYIDGFDPHNAMTVYQLLYILASNVPFMPNISKLSV